MPRSVFVAAAAGVSAVIAGEANAAISYATPGSTYSQNFNNKDLPGDRNDNQNIEVGNANTTVDYTDGWQDDVNAASTPQDDVSVIGWYLRHPISPASENGFNGHQRFRMGFGQNTGSFWGFAPSADVDEKALGSIGGTGVAADNANMFTALRLTNTTGVTLAHATVESRHGHS